MRAVYSSTVCDCGPGWVWSAPSPRELPGYVTCKHWPESTSRCKRSALSHTLSLCHSLPHSPAVSLPLPHSLTVSLSVGSLAQTWSLSLSLCLSCSLSLSLSVSVTRLRSLSFTACCSPSPTYPLTLPFWHTLFMCVCLSLPCFCCSPTLSG